MLSLGGRFDGNVCVNAAHLNSMDRVINEHAFWIGRSGKKPIMSMMRLRSRHCLLTALMSAVVLEGLCGSTQVHVIDAAHAHGYKRNTLEVVHPFTFEKPEPGGRDAIVGMTLRNKGKQAERLIGASSTIADKVEIVAPTDGAPPAAKAQTTATPRIEIKPGQAVELRPSSAHLRLVGLKKTLTAYGTLPMTLIFEKAGRLKIDVMVEEVIEK